MSLLLKRSYLPQIPAGDYSLCKLFSCPEAYILRFCHRFQIGSSLHRLICHVPAAQMRLFATKFGWRLLLVQAFFMSRRLYPALLPQISDRVLPSLAHLSCPRHRDVAICHRFWLEATPCASFFHVPVSISCASATDLSGIQIARKHFTCQ